METNTNKQKIDQAQKSLARALDAIGPFLPKREIPQLGKSDHWYGSQADQAHKDARANEADTVARVATTFSGTGRDGNFERKQETDNT